MSTLNNYINGWMTHRKALHELIDTFDSKNLQYKPWDEGMSVSELVLHISTSTNMFAQTVKNGVFAPPATPKTPETISELKQLVEADTAETNSALESITDEQLNQIVEFAGMKMPGIAMLEMAKEHEIHHKGQLFTYARLLGIEKLPFFISR